MSHVASDFINPVSMQDQMQELECISQLTNMLTSGRRIRRQILVIQAVRRPATQSEGAET